MNVNGNHIKERDYSGLGKTTTTQWGQTNNDGERLDCYWNLAKNEVGTGATDAEIMEVMNEIMELNSLQNELSL